MALRGAVSWAILAARRTSTVSPSLAERRRLLVAALGFARLESRDPAVEAVRAWLEGWSGLGLVVGGLARQGYDLQLTAYADRGWRATFYVTGVVHSIVAGSAYAPTPWAAVQRAAWQALA
jgi:hypothetical protein